MSQSQTILEDIKQIVLQFKNEVPRRRTTWSNSIRHRIAALHGLGMSSMAISKETAIPYHTVLKWKNAVGEFKEVSTVTVPTLSSPSLAPVATVTVTTPNGCRVDGLSFERLLCVFERLG